MAKRNEGAWEEAFKDLKYFVLHNLEGIELANVKSEIGIIENNLLKRKDDKNAKLVQG